MRWIFDVVLIAAGIGLAHLVSRAPELHRLRRIQAICFPVILLVGFGLLPFGSGRNALGDLACFTAFLVPVALMAILLAPSLAFNCGAGFVTFLDPPNWTPAHEEIRLGHVQKMIDHDRHQDALDELEELLKKHEPTYEALLLKTKLLFHFTSHNASAATLLQMIPLCRSFQQQMAVMESLQALVRQFACVPVSRTAESPTQFELMHELLLFEGRGNDLSRHKMIEPGTYEVEEIRVGQARWIKLKGTDWGNHLACWESVRRVAAVEPSLGRRVARRLLAAPDGEPMVLAQAKARELLKQALQLTDEEKWGEAVSVLHEAFRYDPRNYEIAFRLMEAARRNGSKARTRDLLKEVGRMGTWTEREWNLLQHGC